MLDSALLGIGVEIRAEMHTRKVGSIAKVACYPCKHPVHLCAMTKVVVDGQGKCQRSDAMSCMVLYKLNNDLVMEMGGNRSFEDFREWMLGTTSYAGKTLCAGMVCV